jgi:ABC-2 type transport system ATP-binding protein
MLVVDHIQRSFGTIRAVRDVAFTIPRGETFGLLGPNGAGKTTTMRIILGIYQPDAGRVTWDGAPIRAEQRSHFGYLPEERGIYGKMKVLDQLIYFARLHGVHETAAQTNAAEWLERLELTKYAKRPTSELSKGNQQKVQVACAAVHKPELLILDEPFSGLDPVNANILLDALQWLRSTGTTLVLSSHQMYQIESLCNRFCIIDAGEVRASGTLAELRDAWPTRRLLVEPNDAGLRGILDAVPGAHANGGRNGTLAYDVPRDEALPALLRSLVAAGPVDRFEPVEPSLNDIYLRAIGERG